MKEQASYDMDGESKDLLLFDYLEGNLTAKRAQELEAALACDTELQAELESWKESFVVQDFYPTASLESQLLSLKPKPFSFFGPAAGFLLVLVTSLFSFLPVGEAPERSYSQQSVPSNPTAQQAKVEEMEQLVVQKKTAAVRSFSKVVGKKRANAKPAEGKLKITPETPEEILPEVERANPVEDGNFYTIEIQAVKVQKLRIKKAVEPKEVSRKQQRQINRMKERGLRQKRANEFLKGNKPYVVPLETENF